MSMDTVKAEPILPVKNDTMSAATHRQADELKPAIPVFSYAQAAKCKPSSAISSNPSINRSPMDHTNSDDKTISKSENGTASVESKDLSSMSIASKEKPGTANATHTELKILPKEAEIPNGTAEASTASEKLDDSSHNRPEVASREPSPTYGTTSVSTLHKEDDGFSNVNGNGSSDSTWDKQSQSSQNGSKVEEKASTGKETAQTGSNPSWDEEKPAPVAFKEAPPPSINFWAQRMAQIPKAKPQQAGSTHMSKPAPSSVPSIPLSDQGRDLDNANETKRPENKRKANNRGEERPPIQEGIKMMDGKAKAGEAVRPNGTVTTPQLPPPPPAGDAISWPTPDTAVEEDKKKHHDRADKIDKDKSANAKPHGKKEWQHVPFVPTVNFNTPLPTARRDGRGGRSTGARGEGAVRGRNINGTEKSTPTNLNSNGTFPGGDERARATLNTSGPTSSNQRPKRASSAGPSTVKEQRRPGESTPHEKNKEASIPQGRLLQGKEVGPGGARRLSATGIADSQAYKTANGKTVNRENTFNKRPQPFSSDDAHLVYGPAPTFNHNVDGSMKSQEPFKDGQSSFVPRERGEGRSDRGRGGYRGRGNPNHINGFPSNGHGYANAYASQYAAMAGPSSRSFSNHERSAAQAQGPSYYTQGLAGPPQNHSHRSNSRSQSYQPSQGRFTNGSHAGLPHLTNLQTDLANNYAFQPEPQGSMSAIPFNPYTMPQTNLFGMVTVQIEYYFSVDNLCKDTFLRSHMNSQGFVPLSLVAGFRRIQQLTPDIELIRYVCMMSHIIESQQAEDGADWLRRRDDWKQWIMSIEDRVPAAQNDGPPLASLAPFRPTEIYAPVQVAEDDRQKMSPRSDATTAPIDNMQYQSLDSVVPSGGQIVNMPQEPPSSMYQATRTPLSAAVSEFSPSVRSSSSRVFATSDAHAHGTTITSDDEMDKLCITFRTKPIDVSAPALPPFHSASSRTFSNGSIDGASISNELHKFAERQSRANLNGDSHDSISPAKINRSRSPYGVGSSSRTVAPMSPPVLWFKDMDNGTPVNPLPTEYTHASYPVFRQKALSQRETMPNDPCVYDMQVLYSFWAHYLIRNFNATTYDQFKSLAVEDEDQRKSTFGVHSLVQYYDEALLGQRTVPGDNVVSDFLDLVKKEDPTSERPLFKKLRAAWRNGAFSHKNRSKILKIVDADLKSELDK